MHDLERRPGLQTRLPGETDALLHPKAGSSELLSLVATCSTWNTWTPKALGILINEILLSSQVAGSEDPASIPNREVKGQAYSP